VVLVSHHAHEIGHHLKQEAAESANQAPSPPPPRPKS